MSEKMHHEPDVALTETEARQVLERAAQSEIRGDTLTVAELKRVAQEAGFSPEYVDRAIAEILESVGRRLSTVGAGVHRRKR